MLLGVFVIFLMCILHQIAAFRSSGLMTQQLGRRSVPLLRQAVKGEDMEATIIPPSYNFAIGCFATGGLQVFGFHNYILAAPLLALATLLTVQSGRVRFQFDQTSLEVLAKKADSDGLESSGENFAVGGANRWRYDSFTKWGFIPSKSLPLFMYFRENQTPNAPPEGQFHLFPVIMSAKELGEKMVELVGADKET